MRKGLTILAVAATVSLVAFAATVQNVVGTVTGNDRTPLSGTQVGFYDAVNAELLASATTDSSGRYDSGSIPVGDYRIGFLPNGDYFPKFYGTEFSVFCSAEIVPILASTTSVIDGQLRPREPQHLVDDPPGPAVLEGTVVDAATNASLPGIRVNILIALDASFVASVITDASGHFSYTFEGRQSRRVRIRFTDPGGSYAPEFYGADTDAFCPATILNLAEMGASIDVSLEKVPPAQLTQQLSETVESLGLPPTVETVLGTPLTQVRKLLADQNPANDSAACGQLASFSNRVEVQERKGELSAAQASELKGMATNVRGSLGCQ